MTTVYYQMTLKRNSNYIVVSYENYMEAKVLNTSYIQRSLLLNSKTGGQCETTIKLHNSFIMNTTTSLIR